MCGIVGWVGFEDSTDALARVRRVLPTLAHRGPDDAGCFVFSPRAPSARLVDHAGLATALPLPASAATDCANVVLGHRRLSIIDLSAAGHQPMATSDGRYVIVLNGEIYNYLELRRELEALGHVFRSRSDTEVLLAAAVQWGAGCLPRLVGMYAFAAVDTHTRRLLLARDSFGMKPLYYCRHPTGGGLAFASEIPALLELSGIPHHAHPAPLYEYLHHGITDYGPETLFSGVQTLPAAHYAELSLDRPGELRCVRYWAPDLNRQVDLSFPDAAARLRDLFLDSIALHLRSDVAVGTLLSGGIDSSAIVMAMRQVGGRHLDIATFSYVGGQGAPSEERWIDLVNQAAGAVAHKVHLEPQDWAAEAERLIEIQGEPFGSIAILAQHRVYRRAAEAGIKVTLDGQGADELLAGYRPHWAARLASLLERGAWVGAYRFLRQVARARQPLDPSVRQIALHAIRLAVPPPLKAGVRRAIGKPWPPWINPDWCRRHGIDPGGSAERTSAGGGRLRRTLWRAVERGSLPALLRYEDRNAMACSVESRLPFLTPRLAEFLLALPEEYLVGPDATSKRVFREAMRGLVPAPILERRDKIGFGVPTSAWLPAIPAVIDLLEVAARLPPLNGTAIEPFLAVLRSGRALPSGVSYLMWRLATLAAWARRFDVTID